jgi:hypothetical protein
VSGSSELAGYLRDVTDHKKFGVRAIDIPDTFKVAEMQDELLGYCNILLGREEPPMANGVFTLMELAEAYHARAAEMEMIILGAEQDGRIKKGERAYRFRTGQLRTFQEMCKRTIDMGSRRITAMQMLSDERG